MRLWALPGTGWLNTGNNRIGVFAGSASVFNTTFSKSPGAAAEACWAPPPGSSQTWVKWTRQFPTITGATAQCYADVDISFAHSARDLALKIQVLAGTGSWAIGRVFLSTDAILAVDENAVSGTTVNPLVKAFDQDGHRLKYEILAGGASSLFNINALSGKVTVASGAVLDHERNSTVKLTVKATDDERGSGGLFDESTVVVQINDINDKFVQLVFIVYPRASPSRSQSSIEGQQPRGVARGSSRTSLSLEPVAASVPRASHATQ